MSIRKIIKSLRNWCPQPSVPQTTKLKRYSMPIAAVITATLIFSVSFSVFSSNLISHPSIPLIIPLSTSNNSNQLWKFTPNGSVYDPPVAVGDYIYVQSYNRNAGIRYVYCLNSSDGAAIWNHTTGSTAIIDGKNVYVKNTINQNGNPVATNIVYALDAITGFQNWNYTSKDSMTPRVTMDGIVYLSTGDINEGFFVYALDTTTGSVLWNYKLPEYVESIDVADGYAFVSFNNVTLHGDMTGHIVTLNAVTGAKLWNYTIQTDAVNVLDIDRLLYVGTSGSNLYVLDPSSGQEIGNYTTKDFGAIPLAYGNLVYARTANSIYALDASTLAKKWSLNFQDSVGNIVPNSPNIYFSVGSVLHSIDGSSGESRWTFDVKQNSTYTVTGNRAYISSFYPINLTVPFIVPSIYSNVYELDALSGAKLFNCTVEGNAMSLEVVGNILYVGTAFATTESQVAEGNGALYALDIPASVPATSPSPSIISSNMLLLVSVLVAAIIIAIVIVILLKKKVKV